MADQYSPKIKEELCNQLRDFFQKKKLKIDYDIHGSIKFNELKENQENSDFILDYYLKKEIKKMGEKKYWMEFVSQLLIKKETQYLGLKFLIGKELYHNDYDYDDYNTIFLNLLKPYKESYMVYINRKKWIEINTDKLSHIVTTLDEQHNREELIKTALKVKSFASLKFKTQLYNIIQKDIKKKKIFEGLFPELENKNENINQFISKINKEEVIFVELNIQQINQYYNQYEMGSSKITQMVSDCAFYANRNIESFQNELNIREIEVKKDEKGKELGVKYYGHNLNEKKLNLFSIFMIQGIVERTFNPLEGDDDLTKNELMQQMTKEALVKANKVYLQNTLSENTGQIARPKL